MTIVITANRVKRRQEVLKQQQLRIRCVTRIQPRNRRAIAQRTQVADGNRIIVTFIKKFQQLIVRKA